MDKPRSISSDQRMTLYGEHILLSSAKAEEKETAKSLAQDNAERQRLERSGTSGVIPLSDRERRIIERLNQTK